MALQQVPIDPVFTGGVDVENLGLVPPRGSRHALGAHAPSFTMSPLRADIKESVNNIPFAGG